MIYIYIHIFVHRCGFVANKHQPHLTASLGMFFFLLKTGIIKRGWEIPKEMTVFQWGDS